MCFISDDTFGCADFEKYCAEETTDLPGLAPMTKDDLDDNLICDVTKYEIKENHHCRGTEMVPKAGENKAVLTFSCKSSCKMTWSTQPTNDLPTDKKVFECMADDMVWQHKGDFKSYPNCGK